MCLLDVLTPSLMDSSDVTVISEAFPVGDVDSIVCVVLPSSGGV